jgi:hypothetical protein
MECHSELVFYGRRPAIEEVIRPSILVVCKQADEADRAKGGDAEEWEENGMLLASITNSGAELLGGCRVCGDRSSEGDRGIKRTSMSPEMRTSRAGICVNAFGCSLSGQLEGSQLLA